MLAATSVREDGLFAYRSKGQYPQAATADQRLAAAVRFRHWPPHFKALNSFLAELLSPLSVRYFRRGRFLAARAVRHYKCTWFPLHSGMHRELLVPRNLIGVPHPAGTSWGWTFQRWPNLEPEIFIRQARVGRGSRIAKSCCSCCCVTFASLRSCRRSTASVLPDSCWRSRRPPASSRWADRGGA
jgi:hypothetical protein